VVLYGAHLSRRTIVEGVKATGAQAAQVFLGSPKSWAAPAKLPETDLKFWADYKLPVYVHSSYLVNPAGNTEDFRAKTIKSLNDQFSAAADIKSSGLVVHGGHASGQTLDVAVARWKECLAQVDMRGVQLLVENTAGGSNAPGRSLEGLQKLWEAIGDYSPKLCLDTCHAWTGNVLDAELPADEAFHKFMDELDASGIEIALTHLNGSMDPRRGGRDHHSNLTASLYSIEVSKSVAERANVPAILETPGPLAVLKAELDALRIGN